MSAPRQSKPRHTEPSASSDPVRMAFRREERADKVLRDAGDIEEDWRRKGAEEIARAKWEIAVSALAITPAATLDGVAVKLRFVLYGLKEGSPTRYDTDILQSALADIRRLA